MSPFLLVLGLAVLAIVLIRPVCDRTPKRRKS